CRKARPSRHSHVLPPAPCSRSTTVIGGAVSIFPTNPTLGAGHDGCKERRMRSFLTVSLLVVVSSLGARANAAPPTSEVKVCVLIEEKSWTEDGTRPAPSATKPPAPAENKEAPPAVLVEPQGTPSRAAGP